MRRVLERHIVIESVSPTLAGGRYPIKRMAGEILAVEATIFRDGSDVIRAAVRWRCRHEAEAREAGMIPVNPGLDRWRGEFTLEENARYRFTVAAWTDGYATWLLDLQKRVEAGQAELTEEVSEGVARIAEVHPRAQGADRTALDDVLTRLKAAGAEPREILSAAAAIEGLMARLQPREDAVLHEPEQEVAADRPRARFGSWYELFVRSQGTTPGKPATFRDAERRLPDIAGMGFDVVYLAPIHPIGKTNRKGRNNSLSASPEDPGSPWAIGSEAGGHDAVEPSLGTIEDFVHYRLEAERLGMEIALDLALQCSPDHPWVREHPDWFRRRPDGTVRFAENPPKKYEDIYPLDFDTPEADALWEEIRRVVLFWVGKGVKIFRVDNPHTKPLRFWRWLIESVQDHHPEVLFLAEAFTRPAMMKALARAGFTQSYTYFTWRITKREITEYLTELTRTEMREYFRPNFFPNTPDILTPILVHGGRPAFTMRLVLAATLSPSYGIYSGYELVETAAVPHHVIPDEFEYADSEKYEIRVRDWNAPLNIRDFVTRVNAIRRENPALQEFLNVEFLDADNEEILFYRKSAGGGSNVLLVAVNLDPFHAQSGFVRVPEWAPGARFEVRDLLTGATYFWSDRNYLLLDPQTGPAHILRVERRVS